MKTLTSKKVNFVICWNNLRLVPPRAFPTIQEMEKTSEVFEVSEAAIPNFVEAIMEGEELRKELAKTGDLPEAKLKEANEAWQIKNKIWQAKTNALEQKEGEEIIAVEFENEVFNTFFQQFERWAKGDERNPGWFANLKEFLTFRKELNATNAQPKGDKSAKKAH